MFKLTSGSLIRHHARTLIQNPSTGIFLGFGWMLTVLLTLSYGGFLASNHAGLELMFGFLPWVLCLLIPALTMNVADEPARGVTERLSTLPFTNTQRLLSRFTVHWLLVGLWLLGLWPMVATVAYLGAPDYGAILAGFLGSWLLAAPMLAASLFIVQLASGSVTGFLMALGACLGLTLIGAPQTVTWLAQSVPSFMAIPLVNFLQAAAPYAAFTQFISGLISVGSFSTLFALTLFFLTLALPKFGRRIPYLVTAVAIFIIALIPAVSRLAIDTTADHLHTLSPVTKRVLRELKEPITFTLTQSVNNPDLPPSVLANATAARKMLLTMQAQNPGKIKIVLANPDSSPVAATRALGRGFEEQVLPSGTSYFSGLAATLPNGHTSLIRNFDPGRQPFLEFDIMALITETLRTTKPVLTILTNVDVNAPAPLPRWLGEVGAAYNAQTMDLDATEVPKDTNLLLIVANFTLPDVTLHALQQYLENGGNIVWLGDPLWRYAPKDLVETSGSNNVSGFFATYGVDVDETHVVADPTLATPVAQDKTGYTAYPFFLSMDDSNLNPQLPFNTFVESLLFGEAGPIRVDNLKSGLTFTPLITTTPHARLMEREAFASIPAELLAGRLSGPESKQILGALITGKFGAGNPGTLLVINDLDWISNALALRAVGGGGPGNPVSYVAINNNQTLFYNALQYAMGETTLVELRGKATTRRTLTRVEALLSELTRRTTVLEDKLDGELYKVNQRLEDLQKSSGKNATAEQNAEIQAYQQQQFLLRQQLRELRAHVRVQIQSMETAMLLLNLLLMPVLLSIGFFLYRRRQPQ